MKRNVTLVFQAAITAAPLMLVLGSLYATGALQHGGAVATAVLTALLTAAAVEPVRSALSRTALADQHRIQFCAQAMIALQVAGDLVSDIVLKYHPNWHPKPTDDQEARGERIVETLLPVIGLARMWAPTVVDPLEVLVSEIRDAFDFLTRKVDDPGESYPGLRQALQEALDAVNAIRGDLPR